MIPLTGAFRDERERLRAAYDAFVPDLRRVFDDARTSRRGFGTTAQGYQRYMDDEQRAVLTEVEERALEAHENAYQRTMESLRRSQEELLREHRVPAALIQQMMAASWIDS